MDVDNIFTQALPFEATTKVTQPTGNKTKIYTTYNIV
jgi:hypothetical protein